MALDGQVQYVRGVGPGRAKALAELGVATVRDLIEHFPFRHELIPKSVAIGELIEGQVATVVGGLRSIRERGHRYRSHITATLIDATGQVRVQWFNCPYLLEQLEPGGTVRLTGKVEVYRDLAALTNPITSVLDEAEDPFAADTDRFEPVYHACAGITSRQIGRAVQAALEKCTHELTDFLPQPLRAGRQLALRRTAIVRYHRPVTERDIPVARRRLAYEELLLCQLAVQIARRSVEQAETAPVIRTTEEIDRRIRARIPFPLTDGQNQAVAEIAADLARPRPMNRMLQADVGAGKTAVAVYAALTAIANKQQVSLLAPTEVLARQHERKVRQYLSGSRVRIGLLTGSTPKADRPALLRAAAAGQLDLLIGTHALIEKTVQFARLGLAIIDEQHKFGVEQRAALTQKGRTPHVLVLSATPIPRTLAMTVFGDLDVSTIRELPPGRAKVTTRLVGPQQLQPAWRFVRQRLSAGEQAYVIYPLVEETDTRPLKAATAEAARLAKEELAGCTVGLLHGRMRPAEKDEVMRRFAAGTLQVLVSTTVVEVGVDVPNATIMVVEHADRYGLTQLHQLRGRVGRGGRPGYCLLLADDPGEPAMQRLGILCQTSDGFRIAEEDLRLRGPGELLGTRQHGLPVFKVANLVDDIELLEQARDDAATVLASDATLARKEHAPLRAELLRRYGSGIRLARVG